MSKVSSGNIAHDTAVSMSEGQRQAIVKAATTQAQVTAADIAHYRNCVASAKANNGSADISTFLTALAEIGVDQ